MESEEIIIGGLLFELMELDELPVVFSAGLWNAFIDRVTVFSDDRLAFRFKDGREVVEKL